MWENIKCSAGSFCGKECKEKSFWLRVGFYFDTKGNAKNRTCKTHIDLRHSQVLHVEACWRLSLWAEVRKCDAMLFLRVWWNIVQLEDGYLSSMLKRGDYFKNIISFACLSTKFCSVFPVSCNLCGGTLVYFLSFVDHIGLFVLQFLALSHGCCSF